MQACNPIGAAGCSRPPCSLNAPIHLLASRLTRTALLQGLGKPVVVTGSIIPMCEVYNDARRNLIVSVMFAAQLELSEVGRHT